MDLTPYVENLRQALATTAAAGGDDARALADRLSASLESATRLNLLEALSAAAEEITQELAPGSVDVRLRGRDPDFIVTSAPAEEPDDTDAPATGSIPSLAAAVGAAADDDDGRTARITLRVPEHLKPRIEDAADGAGLSVNAWLVRAVSVALEPPAARAPGGSRDETRSGQRYNGWLR